MEKARQTAVTKPAKVNAPEQLNLQSMRDVEYRLGMSRERLRGIADNAPSYYDPFPLLKPPRPFAKKEDPPKVRIIDKPVGELFAVQQRIYYRLLRQLEVPDYLCGGVKGRSVSMNVAYHNGAPIIVTLDIKAWFPSITVRHVYRVWRKVLNCTKKVAKLMTRLTTYDGHLPQGSPTSTAIANLVLYSIDEPIRTAAVAKGVVYTSWVDDLPISGSKARQLIPIVIGTLKRAGFNISRSKLKVMGGCKQRLVNGVIVGENPSTSRKHRWRIRAALHRLRRGDIAEWELGKYVKSLKGRISHLESINPSQAKPFQQELSKLLETLSL